MYQGIGTLRDSMQHYRDRLQMKLPTRPAKYPRSEWAIFLLSIALVLILFGAVVAKNACQSDLVKWNVCKSLTEPGVKLGPLIRL